VAIQTVGLKQGGTMRAILAILIITAGSILCGAQVFQDSIDISDRMGIEDTIGGIIGPITEAINGNAYISAHGGVYLPGRGVLLESSITTPATLQDLQLALTDALHRVGDLVVEALDGEMLVVVARNAETGYPEGCFILDNTAIGATDLTEYFHPYDASAYSILYKLSFLSSAFQQSDAIEDIELYAYEYYIPGIGTLLEFSIYDFDDILLSWTSEDWDSYFESVLSSFGGLLLSDLAEGEQLLITFDPSWSEMNYLEIPAGSFESPDEWTSYYIVYSY
jgi:hypothetical protein